MTNMYERGRNTTSALIHHDNHEEEFQISSLLLRFGVEEIIRIPSIHYPNKHERGRRVTHFGLPVHGKKLKRAVLAEIIKGGYFISDREEQQPILSLNNIWIVHISDLIPSTSYDLLPPDCFTNTIGGVRNAEELMELMLFRYSTVLPLLSSEEILAQGVSIRYLELLEKISFP